MVDNLSARKTVSISVERSRQNGAYPVDLGVPEAFGDGWTRRMPATGPVGAYRLSLHVHASTSDGFLSSSGWTIRADGQAVGNGL